ncbi:MAG: transaldolase family protein [Lachnospiraceae bacterium]
MKLYLDDCRMDEIRKLMDLYPVDGITSNPSVLKKSGRNPVEVLTEIRNYIGNDAMLMTQVISTEAEQMVKEAHRIVEIIGDKNYFVKLPANPQGIKAIKQLSKEGIMCNATAIYSVSQGLLAANAGAKAMAPYITRIDQLGGNGLEVTADLQHILNANGLSDVQIVPGSISSVKQVLECAKMGIAGVAISAAVWEKFIDNKSVDYAVDVFNSDFQDLCGEGRTFLDL